VIGIYGWLSLQLVPAMPPLDASVPVALASMAAAWALMQGIGLVGRVPAQPESWHYGVRLALFLTLGLVFALEIVRAINVQYA